MLFRGAIVVVAIGLFGTSFVAAQDRWEKFQQKLEELRPKGKLLQQVRDNLTSDASTDEQPAQDDGQAGDEKSPRGASARSPRKLSAQPASQRSIMNQSRPLPNDGVMLGIQIDPSFLPAQRLVVSEVDDGSPAAKAVIRTGDQIKSVGGIPTDSLTALDGVLDSLNGGDQVVIELIRNRKAAKTLVRFEGTNSAIESTSNEPRGFGAVEQPPPLELLDSPPSPLTTTSNDGLQSVLGSAPAVAAEPLAPMPTTGAEVRVRENDEWTSATPEQMRARIREQQQLIERLQRQVQMLQSSIVPQDQDASEYESLILDADDN
jgi:membrane-associated protease RseP (regulator of RpoE activity)